MICAFLVATGTYAQKGKSELGINFDVAPIISTDPATVNLGVGAKYRYGISNKFRLDANFTYYFPSLINTNARHFFVDVENPDKISMFDISLNIQYLIKFKEKFIIYPLVGLGYIRVNVDTQDDYLDALEDNYITPNNIVLNVGAGFEYQITDHFNAGIEIKYPITVDCNPMPITLGICYKF